MLYRATLALIARRSRDGLAASPLLIEARTTLYRACVSPARHNLAQLTPAESGCNGQDDDLIGIAEAAELLRVSKRQPQRFVARDADLGVRVGSIWVTKRPVVLGRC